MWDFRVETPVTFKIPYRHLLRQTSRSNLSFNSFDYFQNRLQMGGFLVHQNHYRTLSVGLFRDDKPRIFSTFFEPKDSWGRSGLGVFAAASDLAPDEGELFWQNIKNHLAQDRPIIAPFNGHHYLGFSLPEAGVDPQKIGFMTAAQNRQIQTLFSSQGQSIYRNYHSLETEITPALVTELRSKIGEQPAKFGVRNFSRMQAKRDLRIMNRLVNSCFTEHFDFMPLTDEENWDIMKWAVPLFHKGTFLFLMNEGREIGFAFATLDYNQILGPVSDAKNSVSLLSRKSQVDRARLIHIGILREYRGQKLVKFLRHRLLLNLAGLGVKTVESSYIDEGNLASLGNARSTGGQDLHRFHLFQI